MAEISTPSQQVWVITGTSRGLGLALTEALLEKGHQVAGCSRGPSSLVHPNYSHLQVDLTDEKQVRSWVRQVKERFGKIDVLICNVGFVKSSLFLTLTPMELYRTMVETNLTTTYLICREISKAMIAKRSGRIITIASAMTAWKEPGTSIYTATKSAVVGLTKVLASELASAGITCNAISPALIKTEASGEMSAEWRERILKKQTVAREIKVSELVHTLEFFASPEAACVSGQELYLGLVN